MRKHDARGLVIGRYELCERIAAGGMGEVYVAVQRGIGRFSRPIAIKLLLPHLAEDTRAISMFLTEARVGGQMVHANIAQVYDVGLEHQRYFIAMELVRGVALQKLIAGLREAKEQLSVNLLSYIGRSLCEGLHVAHEQCGPDGKALELVHRDVTPHNVLVGVDGAVKLTDFGIARVADADRLSRPGMVLGKLGYLAPEQITGGVIDRRVDLFAAGATLFHLAALQKPFDTATGSSLDPERRPTVPLRVLRPDLPRSFVDAVEQALEVDPAARFPTAKALRQALPVAGPDAPEELGALVRRVCRAELIDLEAMTLRATEALEPDEASASPLRVNETEASLRPPRSRAPWLVLGGTVLLSVGVGAWSVWPPAPAPVPSPALVAVEPTPEVAAPAAPIGVPDASVKSSVDAGVVVARAALLTVDAIPWASLVLDGRALGETPRADVTVSGGPHLLTATCPDTGKVVQRRFVAVSGERVQLKLDLR